MSTNVSKRLVGTLLILVVTLSQLVPIQTAYADQSVVPVDNLQPNWNAPGGGGVFSAYIAPPDYGYVSPGTTALYEGREAGVIKAGLTPKEDGHYDDEGLFGFAPSLTIEALGEGELTYDVINQEGTNPVWMTIEIDTGIVGTRDDNTTYQHVPTDNPAEWHSVDAGAGLWQMWNNNEGDVSGNPLISLDEVALAHPGLNVVRVYLRLGQGDAYHGSGAGTIGWVDQVTIAAVTYDFVLPDNWYVSTTGADTNPGTEASPFQTIQHAINTAGDGDTIHVAAGTYTENVQLNKRVSLVGAGATTVITNAAGGDTSQGVIQVLASGLSAEEPVLLKDLSIQPVGRSGISIGRFTQSTGTNVSYLSLENVDVTGTNLNPCTEQERGLYVDLTSSLQHLSITGGSFNNLTYGWYFQKAVSADASTVQDVTVDGTTFNHNSLKGLYAEKLEDATFTDIVVDGNGFSTAADLAACPYFQPWQTGVDLNLKAGAYQNIAFVNPQVTDNALGNAKEGSGMGLKARDDGSTYGPFPATLDNVQITGGTISGNERGIRVGEPGKNNAGPTNVQIHAATISDNVKTYTGTDGSAYGGVVNQSLALVDAANNWWGTASGPGPVGPGTGDGVTTNVTFIPWCTDETCETSVTPPVHNTTKGTYHSTIQAAIDAATGGDTIEVAAGTYAENVVVSKSVTIAGAGAGSTTVRPAVSNPNPCTGSSLCGGAASNVFLVQANNVVIHDLTVDGDNPALTSGIVRNNADIDARNGIIKNTNANYNGLEVYNTTVQNIYLRAIYSTGGSFNFHHNTVTNVQGDGYSIGMFAWGGPGTMANNTVSYANDAISANHSSGIQFLNNTVTHSGSGVHTDNAGDGGGVADLIEGNNVSDCTPHGYGVWTFVPYIAPTVNNNTVTNCEIGLSAWGQGAAVTHQFTNNTVTGDLGAESVGAYVTTDLIGWGYTDIAVNFTGNKITGFETGVYLTADQQSWNSEPYQAKTISADFHSNQIYGNTDGAVKGTTGTYAANFERNWWGNANGPSGASPGTGDSVAAGFNYMPWCMNPGCTSMWGPVHNVSMGTYHDTVQAAIDAATAGDTIEVSAGTYAEDLTINKALTLLGPNAAINPNTGTRLAEAILVPSTSNPNPSVCTNAVYLTTSNITLKGFTFDGDNPALTSGIMINGADVDACELLAGYEGMGNIVVENNILKHSTYAGIDFYNYTSSVATAGNYIRYNLFEDIGETTYNSGVGILVYNNFYADITDNVLNRVRTGIQTGNFEKANPGTTGRISNNVINTWRLGIFHNLWYSNASVISVDHNTINAVPYAGATKWNGMLLSTFQGNTNTIVADNMINIPANVTFPAPGYTAGYNVWSDSTSAALTISGGTVTGGDYGVFVNNYEGYVSNGVNTNIILDGLNIQGSIIAGIYVKDSPDNTNGSHVFANIKNSTIDTAGTGILIEGADATAVANFNKIAGNPTLGLNNTTSTPVNAEKNWWGSASPVWASTVSTNALYAPWCANEACTIFANLPVHNVTKDTYFATIQAAINAADTGDTIHVAAGTYDEDVNLNKALSLIGAGAASTTIRGVIGGDGATIRVNANNVEVTGFTITRLGNNLTDWNNAGLNSAGIAIIGPSLTGMNIHDNILSGNRTAIDVNNSSGHTIHNNVITDNRTGLFFRNQTDSLTVTENDITNNWTVGVLFLDASGGTNSPLQTALNSTFSNNNISGNWYGQVVDRQSGGSLPLPGTTNLKNFAENWWGTAVPVVSTANGSEPGYAAQIPVAYGGTAVAPGGQPDILGSASANIIYDPHCGNAACSILVQSPPAFNKSWPLSGASGQASNATLYWGTSTGASSYEYCYATSAAGCTNWTSTGTSKSVTLSGLSANTLYYWQVRAVNSTGMTYANGTPSAHWTFTTGTVPGGFSKSWPSNGMYGQGPNPTLSWGTSSGASSYEYCLAMSAGGCTNWTSTGTSKSVTLSGLNQNTLYYWHVRSVNSFGTVYAGGSPTAHWTFRTGMIPGAFERSWPSNGLGGQGPTPTLYWGTSNGASSYEYCVATSAAECTNWISRGTLKYVTLSGLSANTTYYWHVRAVSNFGTTYAGGSETAHWTITTGGAAGAFERNWPISGVTNQGPSTTVYWNKSNGAVSYEYCYATSQTGCTNWTNVGTARSAVLSGLSANTTYYWQVRAVSSFGLLTYAGGSETVYWTLTTGGASGAFNKNWPSNGLTGQASNATLYWSTSSGASSYEYCVATSAVECTDWVSVGTLKTATLSGLSANTTYYWQVRAVSAFGLHMYANGSETAHWTFTTAP